MECMKVRYVIEVYCVDEIFFTENSVNRKILLMFSINMRNEKEAAEETDRVLVSVFDSRWHYVTLKSPHICIHPFSQQSPQGCLHNSISACQMAV